ncbi:PQQ-dependent sugar dehydrogenase [Flavobacteriaceae bacterium]|nr:PQQ-dependent sugar dehydrogenase [Flavobacteriaceae bacterium]
MRLIYHLTLLTIIGNLSLSAQSFSLSPVANGFNAPLNIQNAQDERLFIVEQGGRIKILNPDGSVESTPFLNLSSSISSGGERGLLGLAFHQNYTDNGYFFVNYTNPNGNTQISRFSVDPLNPNLADPTSELPLITIVQPYANHNGGCIAFGPDGYLYIGMGDGGSGGDPQNYAQNTSSLLGKLLRIDIDNPSGNLNYSIPEDNPYFGSTTQAQEIWAYGLRNPWKFSFDRDNGDLWIADVGQNAFEEINKVSYTQADINYGWRCYEGDESYNTSNCADPSGMEFPLAVYPHSIGSSITGGYVYRGPENSPLQGHYLFADFVSGYLGVLDPASGNVVFDQNLNQNWASFGEGIDGSLYLTAFNGVVYKIEPEIVLGQTDLVKGLQISPNPAHDQALFNTTNISGYVIYDLKGQKITSAKINQDRTVLNTTDWPSGLYLIQATYNDGGISMQKLMVHH